MLLFFMLSNTYKRRMRYVQQQYAGTDYRKFMWMIERNKNMTKKQYENLKIGDLVTCSGGPNKNVIMRVTRKYFGCGGSNCLKAEGIEPNTVYNQRKAFRNDNWTCGAASCFKVIKGTEILEDGTEYYPPINSCSYDEHELDMYFIGDNYGKDED